MINKPGLPRRISPFAQLVGLTFRINEGAGQCLLDISERILNVNGTVHGGAISTLADVSMGWKIFEHLSDKESITTLEMKINYFSAVSSGTLVAEAMLLHRSRRLAVLESKITCGDSLVAKATGTFYVVPATNSDSNNAGA